MKHIAVGITDSRDMVDQFRADAKNDIIQKRIENDTAFSQNEDGEELRKFGQLLMNDYFALGETRTNMLYLSL